MLLRSSNNLHDVIACVVQGYGGARILNYAQKATVANPLHAALCFGGIALTQRLFFKACNSVFDKTFSLRKDFRLAYFLFKKAISYGFATYTTLKVMHLAGLIASVPSAFAIGASVGLYLLTKQVIELTTSSGKTQPLDLRPY